MIDHVWLIPLIKSHIYSIYLKVHRIGPGKCSPLDLQAKYENVLPGTVAALLREPFSLRLDMYELDYTAKKKWQCLDSAVPFPSSRNWFFKYFLVRWLSDVSDCDITLFTVQTTSRRADERR